MSAVKILPLFVLAIGTTALFEEDDCVVVHTNRSIEAGKCLNINKCDFAKKLLENSKIPQTCGFNRKTALVCCPVILNQKTKSFTTKAEEKCFEYHNINSRKSQVQVAHGLQASPREFPHMAAIGYGADKNHISWLCGGSLISERFILTAAHCTNSRNFGTPGWVRLGDLNLQADTEDALPEDIIISNIFVHPDYRPPSHYHDIGLLKLVKSVNFNSYMSPACLQIKANISTNKLQVIGWGKTEFQGESSSHLMKATVNVVAHRNCTKKYANVSKRKLKNGIAADLQICAGDESGRDTCPGDSGGPLHYLSYGDMDVLPHFVIVGITSFGKACGLENSCGVYTRVSAYVRWIEDIVWPSNK